MAVPIGIQRRPLRTGPGWRDSRTLRCGTERVPGLSIHEEIVGVSDEGSGSVRFGLALSGGDSGPYSSTWVSYAS